ncbi:MAG TPA: rhomboid family protein [Chthoniobacteraceae bacterium]|jgi:hypothetical protein|nr:rhomboid family protein [Chthoniobacteraceae bacterium]
MTPALTLQRCIHHPAREAVARCPECGRYFCRECITEHEDRVICADCLRRIAGGPEKRRDRFAWFGRLVWSALGLLLAWIVFYEIGHGLSLIPSSFHSNALWHLDQQ